MRVWIKEVGFLWEFYELDWWDIKEVERIGNNVEGYVFSILGIWFIKFFGFFYSVYYNYN